MTNQIYSKLLPKPQLCFQKQTVQMPGKLYLSGEYAVLEPGHPAIIIAVNQYLTSEICLAFPADHGQIQSDLPDLTPLVYQRDSTQSTPFQWLALDTGGWQYVLAAIETVEHLLTELGRPLQNFNLTLHTQLNHQQGLKLGLGSSAAVVLAVIQSLLQFYGYQPSSEILYKLGVITLRQLDHQGSWGDLAAIANGGITYYCRPDIEWLVQFTQQHAGTILPLLLHDWPLLEIESLPCPQDFQLLVAWTQAPASTDQMVQAVTHGKKNQPSHQQADFLTHAKQIVAQMKAAFIANNLLQIQATMADYRFQLLQLSKASHTPIETPQLEQLISLAQAHQFEAKSSGAGGGDCGIAVGSTTQNSQALQAAWCAHGILPLNLSISPSSTIEGSLSPHGYS